MHNLLLVDDRKDVVTRIKQAINWQNLDITIYTAYNGLDALEIIETLGIDIVITDIKMPKMTGIELIKTCRDKGYDCKFVLISGYDDFEYAKQAIRFGVTDYLLKPIQVDDLLGVIQNIIKDLQKTQLQNQSLEKMRLHEHRMQIAEKNQYFNTLISQNVETNAKSIHNTQVKIAVDTLNCYLILFYIEENLIEPKNEKLHDLQLIKYALNNITQEIFEQEFYADLFSVENNKLVLLCSPKQNMREIKAQYSLYELTQEVQQTFFKYFKRDVSAIISERYTGKMAVKNAFENCTYILKTHFRLKGGQILLESECATCEEVPEYPTEFALNLSRGLSLGDTNSAVQTIQQLCAHIANNENSAKTPHIAKLCKILSDIYKENNMEFPIVQASAQMMNFAFFEDLQSYLTAMITTFKSENNTVESTGSIETEMHKIEQYVEQNYKQSITLKEIAEHLYLSQSYISTCFKEVVGINFNAYLTEVRLKHAKELLLTGHYKIYQIAQEVGYQDAKYFSEIFKKSTGYLPKEWLKLQSKIK